MQYFACGKSGLKLPRVSLGLWNNFGETDCKKVAKEMITFAWDNGITHFDLANIYGPPKGEAESFLGKVLKEEFLGKRDQMVISTKAGWPMWEGPYGDGGSRKHLIASLDQSLERLGLDYVDIFYHHRPDTSTPLEESMMALDHLVRQGKALYAGISSYNAEQSRQAFKILRKLGTPCSIHQPLYNMFTRGPERELFPLLEREGIGCIPFSPLAQGLLSDRYLNGEIPADSRAASPHGYLKSEAITDRKLRILKKLDELAQERNESLACMSLAWVLRQKAVSSVLIGASRVSQIKDNLQCLNSSPFTEDQLDRITQIIDDEQEGRG